MAGIVYFSSVSENTKRFVDKLELPAQRIPLRAITPMILASEPFVLIVPTYGGGTPSGAVPKQVIKFLNIEHNRSLIRGVISSGNTNFGPAYGLAGDIISSKCRVPMLYRFELMGTPDDVRVVHEGLEQFWKRHSIGQAA